MKIVKKIQKQVHNLNNDNISKVDSFSINSQIPSRPKYISYQQDYRGKFAIEIKDMSYTLAP